MRMASIFIKTLFTLSALLFFTACAQEPAEIDYRDGTPSSRFSGLGSTHYPRHIKVRQGETLKDIANKYRVQARDVAALNRLSASDRLKPGQTLTLPHHLTHKVRRGENLLLIARRYKVDFAVISKANRLRAPIKLRPGQVLLIPIARMEAKELKKLESMDHTTHQAVPMPRVKVMKALENTVSEPTSTEQPSDAEQTLDVLEVPHASQENTLSPTATASNENEEVTTLPFTAPPLKATSVKPQANLTKPKTALQKPSKATAESPKMIAGNRFIWPLKGKIIARFGPREGGLRNDGINIMTTARTPVAAAADGVVIYRGNEVKGYGNLLILRHKGGWLTAYAHLHSFNVANHVKVKQGKTIGYVGNTGAVKKPQLHFAIRNGKSPVNPEKYLPKA